MKWFQLDADFFNRPAVRTLRGKYGNAGIHVLLDIWGKIASRIEKTNVSCRLDEGLDLVSADTLVPVDRIDSIICTCCKLVYERINGFDYTLLDMDPIEHKVGSNLMLYKLDNTTSDSPYIKSLKSERNRFKSFQDASKTLGSGFQATSVTDIHTYIQTDLHGLGGPSVGGAATGMIQMDLLKAHAKGEHKDNCVDGCPSCATKQQAVDQ